VTKRIVVALGGSALLHNGQRPEAATQQRNVAAAAAVLSELAADNELVVTHGNAPQVGLLAVEADAYNAVGPYPIDLLGAESQGLIGYLLAQAIRNTTPHADVVTVLTQVIVSARDPAFEEPSKRIGPVYSRREARELAREHNWSIAPDGNYFRRVVASPEPREIVELGAIERLLDGGSIVVCAGGGGVPVVADRAGLHGVEAIIDKDLTAALLAESVGAERLILATDVPAVLDWWGTHTALPIATASPGDLRRRTFARGSMSPKVEAACRFVERTGGTCAIGALTDLSRLVDGTAGTQVTPDWARATA
jgi:carbamate kinase